MEFYFLFQCYFEKKTTKTSVYNYFQYIVFCGKKKSNRVVVCLHLLRLGPSCYFVFFILNGEGTKNHRMVEFLVSQKRHNFPIDQIKNTRYRYFDNNFHMNWLKNIRKKIKTQLLYLFLHSTTGELTYMCDFSKIIYAVVIINITLRFSCFH